MTGIFADSAFLPQGWCRNVRISVRGAIVAAVETGVTAQPEDEKHKAIVPGLCNLHSHAFQRGMAGMAEVRGPGRDSFWSWRKAMYAFALAVNPEQFEAIATQLYVEMLEAGFTRVGEFHYLHHGTDGRPYADISELSQRIAAASSETGITLTLLPVFYAHAGFGGAPPRQEQRRFTNTLDGYAGLLDRCRDILRNLPGSRLGLAPHSLRAVNPEELRYILPLAQGGPIHIHIAEQVKEVEDCVAWSGLRPVAWLLSNVPVDQNWTLIHATHMTVKETHALAESRAIAGLCPITEANLGDGVFNAVTFLERGGRFGVGTDSNIRVSAAAELQMLEYGQRLTHRSRNLVATEMQSTGERLFTEALMGGAQSLRGTGHIMVGADADLVSLDVSRANFACPESLFDHWIFGSGVGVDSVWVRGRKCVQNGRHSRRDRIAEAFNTMMLELLRQMP